MQYLVRFLWFLVRNVFALSVVAVLIVVSFFIAMNASNMYVLLNDGLEQRASVILLKEDASELNKFFTDGFLAKDNMLKSNEYQDYIIRTFDHGVSIKWMWVWPWEKKASATIIERVRNIDGELPEENMTDEQKEAGKKIAPPKWQNAEYKVMMKKVDTIWKIDDLILIAPVTDTIDKKGTTETNENS